MQAKRIYGLMAVLLLLTLGCYLIDFSGADWVSAVCVVNLPVLLILACLSGQSRRRGLWILAGLSLLLTGGFLTLLAMDVWAPSRAGFAPLVIMMVCLWLIPWVWVTWGFIWIFDSFWPGEKAILKLKGMASKKVGSTAPVRKEVS